MSSINFDNPWLLLLFLPLLLVVVLPFFFTVGKENRNAHNVTSCILHVIIAALVSLSAAGTSLKSVLTETSVYVVADLSYSTEKNLDKMDGYIDDLYDDLPLNTKLGIVCFGGTDSHVVHTRLGEKPTSVKKSVEKLNVTSTDICSALEYTSKIFKSGVIKRIVLITDAKNSNESDPNALKRTVDALHASEIYVDAIYLDSNLAQTESEVQISGVDFADRVYKEKEATANVTIESTVATRATLTVKKDGEILRQEPIDVGVGVRSLPVSLSTEDSGEFSYSVSLEDIEKDGSPFNNVCTFKQTVSSAAKTLFITSSNTENADGSYNEEFGLDEERAREFYGEEFGESFILKYDDDPTIPYTVAGLCEYDEIVLSSANVKNIRNYEMFVESLDICVSLLGKSLVAIGDLGLHDATDESLLRLAGMLPVRYGAPDRQQRLVAILLDVSHSMNLNGKMAIAKSAAKQLVDLLEDTDEVAVITFHGNAEIKQGITFASNRVTVKETIDNLEDKHGTVISGGFVGALEVLRNEAQTKETQIYLITDGINADANDSAVTAKNLADDLYLNYDVPTSVVAVQAKKDDDAYNAMKPLATSGNIWSAMTEDDLNDFVLADIKKDFGAVLVTKNAWVDKAQRYDEVLQGIDDVSYLRGYLASREKANATTVLTIEHQRETGAAITLPIYSYWKYGNGKTASFTSKFSGAWLGTQNYVTGEWNAWRGKGIDKQFFTNVLDVNVPTEKVDTPFVSALEKRSGGVDLEIRPAQLKAGATVRVALLNGDERTEITGVGFDSNKYSCSFALPTVGDYSVEITYEYKGERYTQIRSISLSYLDEYDRFATFEAAPLYKMLGDKGTVSEDGKLKIVNDENEVGVQIIRLAVPLLILAVLLFTVDVIVRKLKWADIVGIFRKIKKGDKV